MTLKIKTIQNQIVEVDASEIYEALATINELTELYANVWQDEFGQKWRLTRKGFTRIEK